MTPLRPAYGNQRLERDVGCPIDAEKPERR